jgi:tetratricopeptide (TPR) repeat protein
MGRVVFLAMVMALCTVVAVLEMIIALSWAPLVAAFCGWVFVGVYALVQSTALRKAGGAAGSILVPSGDATPSVAQHSNIEALEMKGEYAKAAAAYRAAIAADPGDIVACEKLGQLALRQLKDYDTAVWAYHQAELRATDPRRRVGYALLALGIVRDNQQDTGRTVVEIRKLLERYPAVQNADALRTEMDHLKATLFEGSTPT